MSEKAEEIKVTINQSTNGKFDVELPANSTAFDLAKLAAQKLKSGYPGSNFRFRLLLGSVHDLAKCRDKSLSDMGIDNNSVVSCFPFHINKDSEGVPDPSSYFTIKEFATDYKEANTNQQSGKQSSWPLPSIIVGVIDLLLLAAVIITFSLFFFNEFNFFHCCSDCFDCFICCIYCFTLWMEQFIAKILVRKLSKKTKFGN